MSDLFSLEASPRKLMTHARLLLGVVALMVASAPRVGLAYNVTCHNGYTSFLCNDGTLVTCISGGQQFDCPEDNGPRHCASHGGLKAIVTDGGARAANYLGKFDLSSMSCDHCSTGVPPPMLYAGWMGTCGDRALMICSEMDADCAAKQRNFMAFCSQLHEKTTVVWYLEFPPQLTCAQR